LIGKLSGSTVFLGRLLLWGKKKVVYSTEGDFDPFLLCWSRRLAGKKGIFFPLNFSFIFKRLFKKEKKKKKS